MTVLCTDQFETSPSISCYSRAFEHIFPPGGWRFDRPNFQKLKLPGSAREGGTLTSVSIVS